MQSSAHHSSARCNAPTDTAVWPALWVRPSRTQRASSPQARHRRWHQQQPVRLRQTATGRWRPRHPIAHPHRHRPAVPARSVSANCPGSVWHRHSAAWPNPAPAAYRRCPACCHAPARTTLVRPRVRQVVALRRLQRSCCGSLPSDLLQWLRLACDLPSNGRFQPASADRADKTAPSGFAATAAHRRAHCASETRVASASPAAWPVARDRRCHRAGRWSNHPAGGRGHARSASGR